MEFTPQGFCTLSNFHAILVAVNEVGDEVTYKYSDEEEVNVAEILFNEAGEAYFETKWGRTYYLDTFMTITF
jgi:hypothetical protein